MNALKLAVPVLALAFAAADAQDLKDQLLNYQYERIQLTHAAQSKIMDLIRAKDFDSVTLLVRFGDSINSPNPDWLVNADRFLLKLIEPDTGFLTKPENYIEYLGFTDSIPEDMFFFPPGIAAGGDNTDELFRDCRVTVSTANLMNELHKYLVMYGRERLNSFAETDTANAYIWEFIQIFYPKASSPRERHGYYYYHGWLDERKEINKKVEAYLAKYRDNVFTRLILHNLYRKFKYSGSGCILGLGAAYNHYDEKTAELFKDGAFFYSYFDIYIDRVPVKFGLTVSTRHIANELIRDGDTLPKTVALRNTYWTFSSGYLFRASKKWHFTPYVGVNIGLTGIADTAEENRYPSFDFPAMFGCQAGVSIDYQLTVAGQDAVYGPYVNLGIRFDAGFQYNDFSRIAPGLGANQIYANLGFGIIGWGQKRIDYLDPDEK